jgi:hypothetical protein
VRLDVRLGSLLLGACASALLPRCTLWGAGAGAIIDGSTPGPYEFQPFQEREHPGSAAELPARYELKTGDSIQLKLANGSVVEGRYAGVRGPSARDPESYVLLDRDLETGPDAGPTPRSGANAPPVPFAASEIREVGVDVGGHVWVAGMLIGLALDVAFSVWFLSKIDLQ